MALQIKPSICQFCHKRFKNAQAVRGHLRGCEAYRQSKSLGTMPRGALPRKEPKDQAMNPSKPISEDKSRIGTSKPVQPPRLPSKMHQAQLATVLEISDKIEWLYKECLGHLFVAKVSEGIFRPQGHGGLKEWWILCKDLQACQKICQDIEKAWKVEREAVATLYHSLKGIHERWMTYREESLNRSLQQLDMDEEKREHQRQEIYQSTGRPEEEAQFTTLIAQVRQLLVAT